MASMFVRKVIDKKTGYIRVQICSNVREGKKVKQKIIKHVAVAHNEFEYEKFYKIAVALIDYEKEKLNNAPLIFKNTFDLLENHTQAKPIKKTPNPDIKEEKKLIIDEELKISVKNMSEEKRVIDGTYDFYGLLFHKFGFDKIFDKKSDSNLLRDLIVERISNPKSKLKTHSNILKNFGKAKSLSSIYNLIDKLDEKYQDIIDLTFSCTSSLFENKINMAFFDVTTLYFESVKEDDLRKFGYSKDQQFHSIQITLALATTSEGTPIGYKIFPGNTGEVSTLLNCIEEWKKTLPINDVTFVCDRGLFSFHNLYEIEKRGFKFIVAIPLKKLNEEKKSLILKKNDEKSSLYSPVYLSENKKLYWTQKIPHEQVGKIELPKEQQKKGKKFIEVAVKGKIICTYNFYRAQKDEKDRNKMIDKMKQNFNDKTTKTKKFISNGGYKKYLSEKIRGAVEIDELKIEEDKQWDGLHGIFTNTNLSTKETIQRYKDLVYIENSFRLSKTFLKMRPVYHYKSSRVRGHISLCYLSLCLIKYAEKILKDKNINISPEVLREELISIQSSFIRDKSTNNLYKMPSKMSELSENIYKALDLKRDVAVKIMN